MDQVFLGLIALGVALLVLAAPVVAWIAYLRTRSIDKLARRVDELERLVVERAATPREPVRAEPAPVAARPPVQPSLVRVVDAPLAPPPVAGELVPEPVGASRAPDAPVRGPSALPQPAPQPTSIDWERWIGVRGAAVLGGVFLALAGVFFLQHSIQQRWITPELRCSLGALAGIAAIVGALALRRRGYVATANALTGAGATILYRVTWAARELYELVPPPLAFVAMVAVTVACGWLAVRHASQTIAVFGLVGGFATPLLLGTSAEEPLGLFGYLLLLDLGLIAVGRMRRWPMLALLATLATPLLFGVWLAVGFEERNFGLALVFCGATAVAFAVGGNFGRGGASARWLWSQATAICAPLCFAVYFASRVQLEARLLPLAGLLAALECVALWTAWRQRTPGLVLAAAIGGALTLATWIFSSQVGANEAWQVALIAVVLASIVHAGLELSARRGDASRVGWSLAANAGALSMLGVLAIGAITKRETPLWPWLVAALVLASVTARQASIGVRRAIVVAGFVAASLVLVGWLDFDRGLEYARLAPALELAVFAGFALCITVLGFVVKDALASVWTLRAVCISVALLLVERLLLSSHKGWSPDFAVAETMALAGCGFLAAAGLRSASAYACVAATCWLAQARIGTIVGNTTSDAPFVLFGLVLTWIAVSALPLIASERLGARGFAWRIAALACFAWSGPIAALVDELKPNAPESTVLIAGCALAAAIAFVVRAHARERDAAGRATARAIGFAWFASLAYGFASFAFAFEVEHAVDLIGCALLAAALATLARRIEHRRLYVCALVLCAYLAPRAAGEVLWTVAEPLHELRSGMPVAHWLSYSLAIPAAALFVASRQLRAAASSPAWHATAATTIALLGFTTLFLWLNVEVVNLFSTGERYDFALVRKAARDMTLSAVWAVYALTLLVFAVKLDKTALRWTSLAFFLATIAKVFLYDLGALRGLYRVGSLVGLAFALLLVSMLYQRFVFRARDAQAG